MTKASANSSVDRYILYGDCVIETLDARILWQNSPLNKLQIIESFLF